MHKSLARFLFSLRMTDTCHSLITTEPVTINASSFTATLIKMAHTQAKIKHGE